MSKDVHFFDIDGFSNEIAAAVRDKKVKEIAIAGGGNCCCFMDVTVKSPGSCAESIIAEVRVVSQAQQGSFTHVFVDADGKTVGSIDYRIEEGPCNYAPWVSVPN